MKRAVGGCSQNRFVYLVDNYGIWWQFCVLSYMFENFHKERIKKNKRAQVSLLDLWDTQNSTICDLTSYQGHQWVVTEWLSYTGWNLVLGAGAEHEDPSSAEQLNRWWVFRSPLGTLGLSMPKLVHLFKEPIAFMFE